MSLPDIELILLTALRAQFPAADYGTQIPSDLSERLPFVVVRRIPAPQLHPVLGTRPLVDISVWNGNRKAARDLGYDICAYIVVDLCDGAVSSARAINEPFEIRETSGVDGTAVSPAQGIYRFQATYRLVVRTS